MTASNLADDINTLRASKPRYFRQWLETADPETRQLVMDAIHDASIPSNKLAVVLTKRHDIPITRETIEAYRDAQR